MCPPHSSESSQGTDAPTTGPAWQAALDAGLDMSLVSLSLSKTPWERLQDHDQALAFADILREAGRERNAST